MGEYRIFTDGACDLSEAYCREHRIGVIPLYYSLASAVPVAYATGRRFASKAYYDLLRAGTPVRTSAPSIEDCKDAMRPVLEAGMDILSVGFSSQLSGAYNTARLAALELSEEFPSRTVTVIDSQCGSLGQGLLVMELVKLREQGTGLVQAAAQAQVLRQHIRHYFTVSDLMYLKRGGRISGSTAVVGTVLQIMPLMQLGETGALELCGKIRGRKTALREIADRAGRAAKPGTTVAVGHCDAPEEAAFVKDILRRKYGVRSVLVGDIDPIVGGHGGPGAVAAFCIDGGGSR